MLKYYICIDPVQENTAWYKAVQDVEYFLDTIDFKPIQLHVSIYDMENFLNSVLGSEGTECMILLQYPRVIFEGLNLYKFLDDIKMYRKNIKLVALVHDLDSIRYGDFLYTGHLTETAELNLFDYLITINEDMSDLLVEQGITAGIFTMQIFDYVIDGSYPERQYDGNNIAVAYVGNLKSTKSPFIYLLEELELNNIEITLFGPWFDYGKFRNYNQKIIYRGEFLAESLPQQLNADYGLCWDGDSLNNCSSKICKYLRYTNPHKTSLYLACGIPVIISGEFSTASFIKKENAGIIINDLYELSGILNSITIEEYLIYKENALKLSEKLRSGYFLKNAVNGIEKHIEDNRGY